MKKKLKNELRIKIKDKIIGPGQPCFIIAEMSGNHNQSLERAKKLIEMAAEAKVDAVKLQTYTPDTITLNSDKEYFQVKVNDAWKGKTLYKLYGEAYTPWEWQAELKKYAESLGLILFSTPFDQTAVDFLESLEVSLYKVASFEVVDIPLLEKIGKTKKPVIMSRGMSSKEELELAMKTLKKNGAPSVAVLQCVSSYPAKPEEMNLNTIRDISEKFKVVAGLSSHTLDSRVASLAVASGASIIEQHFTLARADGGPDAAFSLEPNELKELVKTVRQTEIIMGKPFYGAGEKEKESIVFRKSLFTSAPVKKGEKFTTKNVRSVRPGNGLAPKFLKQILGKKAKKDIDFAEPLDWGMVEKK
ncbi:MAG: pseudaminic acid synthase [Candidatus Paceibacterota bacterium]